MSIIPDPNTVVIREDETAKQQQTPWNAWLEHGEREDSLHGGSDDQPANEAVPNAQASSGFQAHEWNCYHMISCVRKDTE